MMTDDDWCDGKEKNKSDSHLRQTSFILGAGGISREIAFCVHFFGSTIIKQSPYRIVGKAGSSETARGETGLGIAPSRNSS
jgi:hypothetical protein